MIDYNRKNYLAPISFLVNKFIYEYDISKANLNVLYHEKVINDDQYNEILSYGRANREIYFGNLIKKDPNVGKILADGISQFRKRFIESNNLSITDILSVKNDAIFVIGKRAKVTKFENVEFKLKNVYTSFYYINKLEIYYYLDVINDRELIDIKGIDDKKLTDHMEYFISFLCSVFESIQTESIESTIDLINNFYNKYINKKIDYGFYRELNSDSLYRLSFPNGLQYLTIGIDKNSFQYLNIMNNLNIIRELSSIVNTIYNNK